MSLLSLVFSVSFSLTAQNKELEGKVSSYKARVRNIEGDMQKLRQQTQVILDKTESDDKLIELLKSEVQRLKQQLRNQQLAANDSKVQSSSHHHDKSDDIYNNPEVTRMRTDLIRLERICKTQVLYTNVSQLF